MGVGAHWRHLANMIEPSVCSGDAALCQITLSSWLTVCALVFACGTVLFAQLEHYVWDLRQHSGIPQHGLHCAVLHRMRAQDSCLRTTGTAMLLLTT